MHDPYGDGPIELTELELAVACAIDAADPGPCISPEEQTSPADWLPEAQAAILAIVQVLRDEATGGTARYAAGWMEAAGWLEEQITNDELFARPDYLGSSEE